MFRAFHEKRDEAGFTLIELLVVILIIAILAAIAIPVFLRQREKGWVSQAESALKNGATAQESYATANNGMYATQKTSLDAEGYRDVSNVTLTVRSGGAGGFCLEAQHALLGTAGDVDYSYSSSTGRPVSGDVCP